MFFKKAKKTGKKRKIAFSFIELSMVLLIIAILIVAIFAGRNLVKKSYILSAQSLTKASAVNSIKDLSFWLETSLEDGFSDDEIEDGSTISNWRSIRPYGYKILASAPSELNKPTYSNTINNIPGIAFDGTNSYLEFNADFLNNSNYTIFILEKRQSNKSNNYFFGDSAVTTENQNIILGYDLDGRIIHSQGGSNSYNSLVSTYANSVDVPRVFSFVFDSSIGKTTYINGYLAGQDSNNSRLSNISTLKIGKGYQGEIGEIIIFSRALRSSERHDVEKYLGKKWSVEVVTGASCEGTVGSGGCIEGDCSGSITGVTGTIEASDGSSDTATCNAAGYTGTASYSCSSTILNVTTPCGCALGYTSSGGACVQDCSVSVTGVSTTSVAVGNGTLTCDVDGYTGSVSYDCSSGGPASITGSCGLDACTGGTVTSSGGITIHKFTSSGTLSCVIGRSAKVLVVAGGGGSGGVGHGFTSGGGGGGGVIYNPSYSIPNGGASVTVGAGGASGAQGGNSVFGSLTAIGGGRSVIYGTTASFAGGSGGGGVDTGGGGTGGAGTSGQGNNGGNYLNFDCGGGVYKRSLGGGGGAGAAGQNAQEGVGGDGGNGVAYDISGTMTYYGGGGGGASRNTTCSGTAGRGGSGGLGGGGAGGNLSRNGTSGTANTGGGGGGMSSSGGSGVVIVSY